MIEGRVIAVCRDYCQLFEGLRARIGELHVTLESVDTACGTPDRYLSKIVSPLPIKTLGRTSLGLVLTAL
jgi:hypothetical protein